MYSSFQAAKQLGSEAAKRSLIREFVKLFSLFNCKIFSLLGRGSNCSSATSYSCERGVNLINSDRATWCAMTDVCANLLKTPVGWAYQSNNKIFIIKRRIDL